MAVIDRLRISDRGEIESPISVAIPATDLFSYITSAGTAISRKSPQYFDATAPDVSYTLEDAELMVKQFGCGLQKTMRLRKQDKVLLYSGNDLLFPIVVWGVTAAGGVFTGASPSATVHELEYQLRDSEATTVITSLEGSKVAIEAARKARLPLDRVLLLVAPNVPDASRTDQGRPSPIRRWTDIWSSSEEARLWTRDRISSVEEAMTTTAVINYSSGTTGLPKGVELTHYNIIANAEQIIAKRLLVEGTTAGRARRDRLDTSGERWLAAVPMYHAFGQSYFCVIAPRLGAKVFIMPKFDLRQYLTFVDIYRITFINVVPAMLAMLCKVEHPSRFNFKCIESMTSGAARLDPATAQRFQQLYLHNGVLVKQGWGMTETTSNLTGFALDDQDDGRSIGWLSPNCKARIVPVEKRQFDGGVVAEGRTLGELWVAGPNVMKGYWKREAETKDAFVIEGGQRWLRTGDIAYVDDRGCFYIVDRMKELIKVNGFQVSPAELENGLMAHEGVVDAAVVAYKEQDREFPRAFVVRQSPAVTVEKLHAWTRERFARYKWFTGGIFFVDGIPRTASGKIVRRELPNPKVPKL
ncbi:acetyl-CoA synthetase-like protein [Aspergillus uvarum CBS 121591]|uniref:Acetyl-CoA synthetase-like protein n=1 Tax=Aspergillus uvarum CBS 121591 TaxID=1448315 RepID=A0A319C9H2_9EURO|nr:acetyl-CoA synthetase-like protein [Aspergillus uvarum CBS 121591]PYH81914.1 acetyl-CoA synthetase-like protein [Aspergillus uvarum CBS 121591]